MLRLEGVLLYNDMTGVRCDVKVYDTNIQFVAHVAHCEVMDKNAMRCTINDCIISCNIYSFLLLSCHLCFTETHYSIVAAAAKTLAGVHLKTYRTTRSTHRRLVCDHCFPRNEEISICSQTLQLPADTVTNLDEVIQRPHQYFVVWSSKRPKLDVARYPVFNEMFNDNPRKDEFPAINTSVVHERAS